MSEASTPVEERVETFDTFSSSVELSSLNFSCIHHITYLRRFSPNQLWQAFTRDLLGYAGYSYFLHRHANAGNFSQAKCRHLDTLRYFDAIIRYPIETLSRLN